MVLYVRNRKDDLIEVWVDGVEFLGNAKSMDEAKEYVREYEKELDNE